MTTTPKVLDDAFDRLGQWGFDEPNGFVNHGPMACEALDALGRTAEIDSWSRLDSGTPPTNPIEARDFVWADALGDPTRAAEWMGHFQLAIAEDGWRPVLAEWLPRLLPGMGVALFHGAIRCAHAARAIESADTAARRAELVRSLGYWAALFEVGPPPDLAAVRGVDDVRRAIVDAAADAARYYVARPNIFNLHGVTAAMAVSILADHTDDGSAATALAQVRAEHDALYADSSPVVDVAVLDITWPTLGEAAVASGDAHAVKLVEACRRGHTVTGDPIFVAAAERVARRGLRVLSAQSSPSHDA